MTIVNLRWLGRRSLEKDAPPKEMGGNGSDYSSPLGCRFRDMRPTLVGPTQDCHFRILSCRRSGSHFEQQIAKESKRNPHNIVKRAHTDRADFCFIRYLLYGSMGSEELLGAVGRKGEVHGEDPFFFCNCRNHEVTQLIRPKQRWSCIWREKMLKWSGHIYRPLNSDSWAAKTFHFHGTRWLQDRRLRLLVGPSGSVFAGRTQTRSAPGIVHRSWHDGIDVARACSF